MNSRKSTSSAKVTFYFIFYSLLIYTFYINIFHNRRGNYPLKILSL